METARPRVLYFPSPLQSHVESPQSPDIPVTQDDLKKIDQSSDQSSSTTVLSPFFPTAPALERKCTASLVGDKYLILDIPEGSTLNKCINVQTQEELVCKVIGREAGGLLSAHYRMDGHPHVNSLREVLLGDKLLYLVFPPSKGGDLHSHVRFRKRLREPVARKLFRQMVSTVKACHDKGIVLRDLKLRKFVFTDSQKTHIKLETLEDAVVLDNPEDDMLHDKRGCPAYVSPEILRSHAPYSGKAADMWSLGVILFTMLVGRYPFSDLDHTNLFMKISRGNFSIPDSVSIKAKCLIRNLMRREPKDRISSEDVLLHPWVVQDDEKSEISQRMDQVVPDIDG